MILTTPNDLWALRYPDTNELWILERSRSAASIPARVSMSKASRGRCGAGGRASFLPATVIASERMNANLGWRLLESGELIHVDPRCG